MMNAGYHTHQRRRSPLTTWVLKFVLLGLVATIVAFIVLVDFGNGNSVGPQQAFETHLAALDEQNWELADTFVLEHCQIDNDVSRETASQDLKRLGFSFSTAFVVDEVWLNVDGRRALLGLETPVNLALPGVASMERVDGDWLVSCS